MDVYPSAVPDDLVRRFPGWEQVFSTTTVGDYRFNQVGIEALLAVAHLFWPRLVSVDGLVLFASKYDPTLAEQLSRRFAGDKRRVERWMNAWELSDIFSTFADHDTTALDRQELVAACGNVLGIFWSLRLRDAFPGRHFTIETGEDIEGSSGWAITFYEAG